MTKTPEELTKEWLNNKLQAGSFWFVETEDSNPEPMVVDMDGDFNDYEGNYYRPCFSKGKLKVLAPVPTYDEYKAMQAAIQNGESAIDTNKRLCKTIEELKEKVEYLEFCKKGLEKWCMEFNTLNAAGIAGINELRELLKECLPIVSAEIMTWQIRGGEESRKRGQGLLTRINAALGESEDDIERLYK